VSQIKIHAAVGIVIGADQKILIAQRPDTKILPGFWEFPGGKIETGETAAQALVREFQEEINITPTEFSWLTKIEHAYPDRIIVLDAFIITHFIGTPHGQEGQAIAWVEQGELINYPFLPANKELIEFFKNWNN
jgi:8-oxo-dGTP diphosphatase